MIANYTEELIRDKTTLEVILGRLKSVEALLAQVLKNQKNPSDLMKEPVVEYQLHVGGRPTGIIGSREKLEGLVVAAVPCETQVYNGEATRWCPGQQ